MSIRVLVVDDHPFYRAGVSSMAPLVDPGIEIVGEAGDGESALEAAAELAPDVVLMDLALPGMTGIEATRALRAQHPQTAVLVLTMMQDDSVLAALDAGAGGYLLKDASVDDVCRGIRSVARGELVVAPGAAPRLIEVLRRPEPLSRAFPELTTREIEVAELIADDAPNTVIARRLFVAQKTARNYVSTVLAKLGAADREDGGELIRRRLAAEAARRAEH